MKCPTCRADNPETVHFCPDCGTRLDGVSFTKTLETPSGELVRGTVFAGRYEIIEELGAGGMGRVYRAYDKKIEEEVALKLIRPEIAAEKRTVERFRNEIKTARKITHKNVCRTHDLGEEGKALFITMEYVRGEDLKSLIRRTKQLAPGTAVAIARQVAEGLGEAHRLGVVHRDLKPGNIMIDRDGNAKVMDFGIARTLAGGGTTVEGAIIGTPEYMSPEQVEGKHADLRSDIYALGAILFEMVTGRPPFEGETAFSVANKHKSEPAPDPRELNPQLPVALGRLVLRCLEKERESRFQTTAEFLADLAAVEAALPAAARVPGRAPSRTKPKTSREITVKLTPRKLVIPGLALAGLVAAALIWHPWSRDEGPPVFFSDRPSIAILNLANRTGEKAFDQFRDVLASMISLDLSQSKYIYVVPFDQVNSILTRLRLLETDTYTRENLREIGRRGVVRYLASGYYTKAGERFLIRLDIQEAESGKRIGTEEAHCTKIDDFFATADELALKIKPHLELTAIEVANDIDGALARVTTSSMEAYRYWIQANKLASALRYAEGIELLKKAVAIDPEFAMAYRSLRSWYYNIGNIVESRKSREKALELSTRLDRLPLREKMTIESDLILGTKARVEALIRLIELYPEDQVGNSNLGLVYSERLEEYDKAAECYLTNVRNKVESLLPYNNLANVYTKLGEHGKAEQILRDHIRLFQGGSALAAVYRSLAGVYLVEGKLKPSLAALDESSRLDPRFARDNLRRKARVYAIRGEFDKALAELGGLLEEKDASLRIDTLWDIGRLHKTLGQFGKAEEALRRALGLARENSLGRQESALAVELLEYYLAAGDFEKAEATHMELEAAERNMGFPPSESLDWLGMKSRILTGKKAFAEAREFAAAQLSVLKQRYNENRGLRYPLMLEGLVELEEGGIEKAIGLLARAKSLLPCQSMLATIDRNAGFMGPLALAYFRKGDLERARLEYEAITRLTMGRLAFGDIYARSFYMLGQIYEQMGKKKEARSNYRKFLELWKDADPGLPEVDDAKKRLAALD